MMKRGDIQSRTVRLRAIILSSCCLMRCWQPVHSFSCSSWRESTRYESWNRQPRTTRLFSSSGESALWSKDDDGTTPHYYSFLATCIPGVAPVLEQELSSFPTDVDIVNIQTSGNAAVTFEATREASLYALCWCRTAHRLLELVVETTSMEDYLFDRHDLYDFCVSAINVAQLLGNGKGGLLTLSTKVILNNPKQLPQDLTHTHFTGLTIKNALVDVVRQARGDRPNVDVQHPDVPLVAILRGQEHVESGELCASVALYRSLSSASSLHKRGYKQGAAMHKASLKESLAAALILQTNKFDPSILQKEDNNTKILLVDPMCGSGTLIIEALCILAQVAPALMRIKCQGGNPWPAVVRWKDPTCPHVADVWKTILQDATAKAQQGMERLLQLRKNDKLVAVANDVHGPALDLLESCLDLAGLSSVVQVHEGDCHDLDLSSHLQEDDDTPQQVWVLTNPPWGIRLDAETSANQDQSVSSWESLATLLKESCPPDRTTAWILSGDKQATRTLRLARDAIVLSVSTGDHQLKWIQYSMRSKQAMEKLQRDRPNKKPQRNERKVVQVRGRERPRNPSRNQVKVSQPPRKFRTKASDEDSWF